MSIEVSGITLTSPNPSGCCDPYTWTITLNVKPPAGTATTTNDTNNADNKKTSTSSSSSSQYPLNGIVDISVLFGSPSCEPEKDVVLDELEIDGSSLRVGKNSIAIEHDALPFEQLKEMMESDSVHCPILMTFKYTYPTTTVATDAAETNTASASSAAADTTFHTCGAEVRIGLKAGLVLEEIDTFLPEHLERKVLVSADQKKGLIHTVRVVKWDADYEDEARAKLEEEKEKGSAASSAAVDDDGEEEMFGGSDSDNDDGSPAEKKARTE